MMMEQEARPTQIKKYPMLLDAKDLQEAVGIPRALAYQLLNRADMPVVCLGRRKFMNRDKFVEIMNDHPEQLSSACAV